MTGNDFSTEEESTASAASPKHTTPRGSVTNNVFFTSSPSGKGRPKKSALSSFLGHLRQSKDLKILFRCSLAAWVVTLFLVISPIFDNFGQATFFGPIYIFINPPSGILFINLLGSLTAIMGMCLAWVWGVIVMKAALATRSTAETNALLGRLAQQATANIQNSEQYSGQSAYTQVLIYNGFALDTRVVVTYLVLIGFMVYLVARIRVAAPKLILLEIFFLIISDIFLTIAPLLPTFTGTIPQVLIKPAAAATAVAVVCSTIIFPESTSHACLSGIESVMEPMKAFVEACSLSFEHHQIEFDLAKLQETKSAVLGAYKGLEAGLGFLALDTSVGRWGAEDISSLKGPLMQVLTTFLGLVQLQIGTTLGAKKTMKHNQVRDTLDEKKPLNTKDLPKHGHLQLMQSLELSRQFPHNEQSDLWSKSMQTMADSSRGILEATGAAIEAVIQALHHVNARRWRNRPSVADCDALRDSHQVVLNRLTHERAAFAAKNTEQLLDHHMHLFNENGKLRLLGDNMSNPIRGLLLSLVFEERILSASHALHTMLEKIIQLETDRTKTRLWPPSSLQHAVPWVFGKTPAPAGNSAGAASNQDTNDKKGSASKKKISKKEEKVKGAEEHTAEHELQVLRVHSGRQRSALSSFLVAAVAWLSSNEGTYALRILIVTIALTLPAVIKHSAGFFYRERGLWALIMAQTGMVLFSADFVFGLVQRVIGTIIGGAIGTAAWYIGAGNGPGSPYGLAAIMAVLVVMFMYCRLFAPPSLLQGFILGAASMYLVVGYSWADTHIPSYGNPGVGYQVWWRRALLVIIGFSAAAIVTFFPHPPSATRDVANSLARNLRNAKNNYALLLTSWHAPPKDLIPVVEKTNLAAFEALAALPGHISMLSFEFSSSNLDPGTLSEVVKQCTAISSNLTQLFYYSTALEPEMKERFAHLTSVIDARLAGDIMAVLSLLEQSLVTGDPLPAVLPTPLLGRMLHYVSEGRDDHALSLHTIREANFRKYCAALNAWVAFIGAIDECVIILKGAVGEEHVVPAWESEVWTHSV